MFRHQPCGLPAEYHHYPRWSSPPAMSTLETSHPRYVKPEGVAMTTDSDEQRLVGWIKSELGFRSYGFIVCEQVGKDVFYHVSHVPADVTLRQGAKVTFRLHYDGPDRPQAHAIALVDHESPPTSTAPITHNNMRHTAVEQSTAPPPSSPTIAAAPAERRPPQPRHPGPSRISTPTSQYLYRWAYLGNMPDTLEALRNLALNEEWEFGSSIRDPDHPHPILHNYLVFTFQRLVSTTTAF